MATRARALTIVALACLAASAAGAYALAASSPRRAVLVVAREDGLWRVRADGHALRLPGTRGARSPAWAPNGRELAFERDGIVFGINADGTGLRPLLAGREPDWSPDGRFLAAERNGTIVVSRRNGHGGRQITSGPADARPAWSPDGVRIAFSRDGVISIVRSSGGEVSTVTPGTDPAWSPDAQSLALATAGGIATIRLGDGRLQLHTLDGRDAAPVFAPGGSELGVVSGENIVAVAANGGSPRSLGPGTAADWALVPTSGELLPDLDQRAPSQLGVAQIGGRFRLGFASAVDNLGPGALWLRGIRSGSAMHARQLVRTTSGAAETHHDAGTLRYTWSSTHSHWHYLGFERYELRRASDYELVGRDRKTGFCLADHYGQARRARPGPPFFHGNCGTGDPRRRSIEQGSSRGYTDRYPAHYHGQNIDLTGVPPGVYLVVHRANPDGLLRERRYDNNAASVRTRLTRTNAVPAVHVLRSCEGSERC